MIVRFTRKAQKYYDNMPKTYQEKIMDGIRGLTKKPPEGDIKNMSGYSDGTKRLRVGKYRVIYKYLNDDMIEVLLILDIGSRGDIYISDGGLYYGDISYRYCIYAKRASRKRTKISL